MEAPDGTRIWILASSADCGLFRDLPRLQSRTLLMRDITTIAVVSDVHYAGAEERERGKTDLQAIDSFLPRTAAAIWRRGVWLRDPFAHNHLLAGAMSRAKDIGADFLIANGDYSCNTAFVGVSDDASFHSAEACVGAIRDAFGDRARFLIGDHELGKCALFSRAGGMQLASWDRVRSELDLDPFWTVPLGRYVLMGVTSSIVALPLLESDTRSEELSVWRRIREKYLRELAEAFEKLHPNQSVVLFCHDPSALPYLLDVPEIRERIGQIDATIVGHLHSKLIWWQSKLFCGMPPIDFMGQSVRRMSQALNRAEIWSRFNTRLCPSLAGSQLLKDGGVLVLALDMEGGDPIDIRLERLSWK
jgi:hypothetical protein